MASFHFGRVNTSLNGPDWYQPTTYLTLEESSAKNAYSGSGLTGISSGFNAIAASNNYLYYYDGLNLAAYNKSTGTKISSTTIASQAIRAQGVSFPKIRPFKMRK